MNFLWATRGREWGFRFLLKGGLSDPLPTYEAAFGDPESSGEMLQRTSRTIAVRLDDPLGRKDRSGRLIQHDFVLLPPLPKDLRTLDDARRILWPLVDERYEQIWDAESPNPS